MKAFRIDIDGVTEIEAEQAEILAAHITWDCVDLDARHDLWVDDEGLLKPGCVTAALLGRRRFPLPAFVLGVDGERSVGAVLEIDEVRAMVRVTPREDSLAIPAIGFDSRQDEYRALQPWRAVLAFPGSCTYATEFLMRLPSSVRYRQPTVCSVYGDLFAFSHTVEDQADAIARQVRAGGYDAVIVAEDQSASTMVMILRRNGIRIETADVHFPRDNTTDDPFYLQGEAGHEIAHLAIPALRGRHIGLAIENGERG